MPKRKPNEEILKDGGREIILSADFGFIVAINSLGKDVAHIYSDLSSGMMPAEDIKNVIKCGIKSDVEDGYVESLVERNGLQECSIIALHLLSHAMIGDVKKSKILTREKIEEMTIKFSPSQSTGLRNLGLLLAANAVISTALVCGIFNLQDLLIL